MRLRSHERSKNRWVDSGKEEFEQLFGIRNRKMVATIGKIGGRSLGRPDLEMDIRTK